MSGKAKPLRLFLTELARRPTDIGAVWPSSAALGRAMARWLPAARDQLVVELGPGTGIVTEQLLAAGLPEERLVAVELSTKLAGFLAERFPKAEILAGNALELGRLLGGRKVGAVFSSLPLTVFSAPQVQQLSTQIHEVLLPGGQWVQYSYHLTNGRAPSPSFHAVNSSIVWRNLPPAKVSVYKAKGAH